MRYCTRCILPDTHETIQFDEEGVCNVCRQAERKHTVINWEERHKMLDELVEQYRNKGIYDCIVPYSGGKDSVYQLWYIVTQLKLKPLVVRFDHWGFRRTNLEPPKNDNAFGSAILWKRLWSAATPSPTMIPPNTPI